MNRDKLLSTGMLVAVFLLCFAQFRRSVDFLGYRDAVIGCLNSGFRVLPYPHGSAQIGDYFQSPVVTLLLVPFAWIPAFGSKLLWALINSACLFVFYKSVVKHVLSPKECFFLMLVFAHPLSDVFISGNLNFAMIVLCYFALLWLSQERVSFQLLGAMALAVAVAIKLVPILLVAWFVLDKKLLRATFVVASCLLLVVFSKWLLPTGAFSSWWLAWYQAIRLYHQASYVGAVSFQAPASSFFRALVGLGFDYLAALKWTQMFSAGLSAVLIFLSLRRTTEVSIALLLSILFLANPFSWAVTELALFPLIYLSIERGISRWAWAAAIGLALIPKGLWPVKTWTLIAKSSVPSAFISVIVVLAILSVLSRRSMLTFRQL